MPFPVAAETVVERLSVTESTVLATVAAVVATLDDAEEVDEALAADPLVLTLTAVTLELLAVAVVVLDLLSPHTVSALAFALRTCPDATAL